MVMFYLPKCRMCNFMKPRFLQAAGKLAANGSNVKLAMCNARENRALLNKFDIKVAPYVKVFHTNYEIGDAEQKAIRKSVKPIMELAEKCELDANGVGCAQLIDEGIEQ